MKAITKTILLLLLLNFFTASIKRTQHRRLDDAAEEDMKGEEAEEKKESSEEESEQEEESSFLEISDSKKENEEVKSEEESEESESILDEEIPLVHQEGAEVPEDEIEEEGEEGEEVEEGKSVKIKKIKDKLIEYETEYKECIEDIKDKDFNHPTIEECTGQSFIKLVLDVKYETMKVIAKEDSAVRSFFINICYAEAEEDLLFATGCDLMEQDVLELLWNGLDFNNIIPVNKEKYTKDIGAMPKRIYRDLMNQLDGFSKDYFDILDAIDLFKEGIIMKLKIFIDERFKEIFEGKTGMTPDREITHLVNINSVILGGEDRKLKKEQEEQKKEKEEREERKLKREKRIKRREVLGRPLGSRESFFGKVKGLDKMRTMKSTNVHTRFSHPQIGHMNFK